VIVGRAKIGRYEIERHVASGGMAEVYQARDPDADRVVALKIPHDGEEIWEAERAGARLQIALSARDARVPSVHEIGDGEERFVAMEYVEGEDLALRLRNGPLDWREATAIAIELCGVLATARSCGASSGEPGGIVHGDIKPRNIRLTPGGGIKVLDFGIAKALRQTRAETRNLYGSVPYSSPERLDRGHVDYASDLWSVAVVLYEMLEGQRPFHAATDAELEHAIRAGAAAPLERDLPRAFGPVLDRALARSLGDRYAGAEDLERDLRAVLLGQTTAAAATLVRTGPDPDATRRTVPSANGASVAPAMAPAGVDPDATRRTLPDAAATHRTVTAGHATTSAATVVAAPAERAPARASYAQAGEPAAVDTPAPAVRPALKRARRVPWKALVLFAVLFIVARELQAFGDARDLRSNLASRPRGEAAAVWNEYRRVMRGHVLVHLSGLGGSVRDWMVSHADDLISRYRSDTPTIYESGWRSAESLLARATTLDPGSRRIQARLEYCRAHLLRIAARDAKPADESMSRYDEAISRFERAARLWPGWGDPYVGLAQIYAYGKRDPELTAAALESARDAHYPFGERETALLGDAYRMRAERRWAGSTDAFDADQQYRHLERVRDDCARALDQYELVPSYPGVSRHLRSLRQRIDEIDRRLRRLTGEGEFAPAPEPPPRTKPEPPLKTPPVSVESL
jgi:serine/threonine-protein kinase